MVTEVHCRVNAVVLCNCLIKSTLVILLQKLVAMEKSIIEDKRGQAFSLDRGKCWSVFLKYYLYKCDFWLDRLLQAEKTLFFLMKAICW